MIPQGVYLVHLHQRERTAKLVEIEKLFERKANSGEWCNGSTTGSEPVSPGSNPGSPACLHRARRLILTKPFYARVNCG